MVICLRVNSNIFNKDTFYNINAMCFINIIMVFGIMASQDFKLDLEVCLHNER